jgi:hypothetical protein
MCDFTLAVVMSYPALADARVARRIKADIPPIAEVSTMLKAVMVFPLRLPVEEGVFFVNLTCRLTRRAHHHPT